MLKLRILLFMVFFVFFLLGGCTLVEVGTPTPFPTAVLVTPLPPTSNHAMPVEIPDLLANPEAAENAIVRLTGYYHSRPQLVCRTDPHPSPATWELAADEVVVAANGFTNQLRQLAPDDLTMTVEGRWLRWRGPIGCGKRAEVAEIWYVEVSRIIDPSPITAVTLTPFIPDSEIAAIPSDGTGTITGTVEILTPTQTIEVPGGQPSPVTTPSNDLPTTVPQETAVISPTNTPEGPPGEVTPTATLDVTPILTSTQPATPTFTPTGEQATPEERDSPTPTPSLTPTPAQTTDPNVTPSLTPTFDPSSSPTPTPDPDATTTPTGTPTPTPTPTVPSGSVTVIEQEALTAQALTVETLNQNEVHNWPFVVSASEQVTITTGTIDNADLVLTIFDSTGTSLIVQDLTRAGDIETISQFTLPAAGTYKVQVSTVNNQKAEYALMLLFSSSLNFIFQDIIQYGDTENVSILAFSEHFWIFAGTVNDEVSITAIPGADTDVFIELYGPDSSRISPAFVNTADNPDATEEYTHVLPTTGLYAIRIGEWEFQAGTYQLDLANTVSVGQKEKLEFMTDLFRGWQYETTKASRCDYFQNRVSHFWSRDLDHRRCIYRLAV